MTHHDAFEVLNKHLPLGEKLVVAHDSIKEYFPFIARIAIALYEPDTGILKTYVHSSGEDDPLAHYQSLLTEAPSLKKILDQGLPRVINNLVTFEDGSHEHTQRIGRQGYAASYTLPMFNNDSFMGFIFFNSYETEVFTERVLHELDLYGHLIALMVVNEISAIKTLTAAVKTTGHITHIRDPETGGHLDRMSCYSRLITRALADKYQLNDDFIEHIFMFAPLHDIGKIGIPDEILLKPGKLTEAERHVMQTHSKKGREMIDSLINNFGLESIQHIDVLRNITEFHHEAMNGSGYPEGLHGKEIPLEARIVAVADVFDALTSKRPYKKAWSNDKAFETLRQMAGGQLAHDCVDVLIEHREDIEQIQAKFKENIYG